MGGKRLNPHDQGAVYKDIAARLDAIGLRVTDLAVVTGINRHHIFDRINKGTPDVVITYVRLIAKLQELEVQFHGTSPSKLYVPPIHEKYSPPPLVVEGTDPELLAAINALRRYK